MFSCFRSCSESPFFLLFGFNKNNNNSNNNYGADRSQKALSSKLSNSSPKKNYRVIKPFDKRTSDETLIACRSWVNYIHPRAKDFWKTSEQIFHILSSICQNIDRADDPILGGEENCVQWHGELAAEDGSPVIRILRPGEVDECQTYVNRILAFLYADDESFLELQKKPPVAFTMACDDPLCINITHIYMDD
ncbi:uncharacterized protein CMU_019790 [Cryptosporidium muris RN66]|uniref:Uncharacterized protein n=1 Tax=Cryptosporidium muris (strain RN66) TaxID=441375 RepID=B6AJ98_CRYMR|nr:uncharacterized protein CMU_019790 [Cryptosporidium muris RN66]EEA08236.1 hypothetical protein, conserved [Cryptosporidium muris RN66]|eukprot:XP_002142585.1 hypothetical protein [Cryptosporidium muris RN66]